MDNIIRDKFYEIMEQENSYDELISEVTEMLTKEKLNGNIKDFDTFSDEEVFDSCGLDIFYLSISWIDKDNKLYTAGSSYYCS